MQDAADVTHLKLQQSAWFPHALHSKCKDRFRDPKLVLDVGSIRAI